MNLLNKLLLGYYVCGLASHIFLFYGGVRKVKPNTKDAPVNGQIRALSVFVIGPQGEQLGEKRIADALTLAQFSGFDLVQVGTGDTPTCKLMDYNKFKYERNKKQKESSKKQRETNSDMKMYVLRPYIDKHDFDTKVNNALKYAKKGAKIKVELRFRNREIIHANLGEELLLKFADALSEYSEIETKSKLEGRRMIMQLTPK